MKWHLTLLLVFAAFLYCLIWCSFELAMRYDQKFAYKQHPRNVLYCEIVYVVLSILIAKHAKLDLGWLFPMPVIGYLLSLSRLEFVVESDRSLLKKLNQDPYYESWKWYDAFLVFCMVQVLGFVIAFYRRPGPARGPERDGQ